MIKYNIACDFETYYDKTVSLKTMGTHAYLRHEQMDIYMLSVVADNGFRYVGRPEDFDWASISGPEFRVLAHNMSFESEVFLRLKELNVIPQGWAPAEMHCTADMCAYLGVPRDLLNAVKSVFKEDLSKAVRSNMVGKLPKDLNPQELKDLDEYALMDSVWCLKLWERCSKDWPLWERDVSRINREIGMRGVDADYAGLEWAANHRLLKIMIAALKKIPWVPSDKAEALARKEINSEQGHAPLSIYAVRKECVNIGIDAPLSMAKDSEDFDVWFAAHRSDVKWAMAMRAYRRANALREKCLKIMDRKKADGRTPVSYFYCGAGNTKRFSGTGGVNYQNLSRGKIFGVDLRGYILPGEGKTFCPSDLSQVEAKTTLWACRDHESLDLAATGMSVYQVHAQNQMGWSGRSLKKEDPLLYALAKARCLALGFGAGHVKFLTMAKNYVSQSEYKAIFDVAVDSEQADKYILYAEGVALRKGPVEHSAWLAEWNKLTPEDRRFRINSWLQVEDYRRSSPLVTATWRSLDNFAKQAAGASDRLLQIELPSGNKLTYRNCRATGDGVTAQIVRNGKYCVSKIYGAAILENIAQALARDVFAYMLIESDNRGFDIALHTHDELVARLVTDGTEESRMEELVAIMSTSPPWMPDLPLAAEAELCSRYKK